MACPSATSLVLSLVLAAQDVAAPKEESPTRVVFLTSPIVDLYFSVRAASSGGTTPELLAPALAPVRELDRAFGGAGLAWGPLDGLLPGCRTAADVKTAFAGASESIELRGGSKVELRKHALEIADALAAIEPGFAPTWEEHAPRLAEARARWEELVAPKERELLDYHLASLGMADPRAELRVYLVAESPWPGAVTVYDDQRRGVSYVAVSVTEGSKLFEIVLHEITHTLDLASGDASALGELRSRLTRAGLGPRDRALHDLPHALMFVQAAESIRRTIDPAHVDYGESEGVYGRLGPSVEALRALWIDHLDGKLTRGEALDEIVASVQRSPR